MEGVKRKRTDLECQRCGETFTEPANLHRHVKRCGGLHRVECPYCLDKFSRKDARDRHVKRKHPQLPKPDCFQCKKCGNTFNWKETLQRHLDACDTSRERTFNCTWPGCQKAFTRNQALQSHILYDHRERQQQGAGVKRMAAEPEVDLPLKKPKTFSMLPDEELVALEGASVLSTFFPQSQSEAYDEKVFLRDTMSRLKQRLEYALQEKRGVKWNLILHVQMKMESGNDKEPVKSSPFFRAGPYLSTYPEDLEEQIYQAAEMVQVRFSNFQGWGSGWTLDHNIHLQLEISEYKPLKGSTYIPLPIGIQNKKAVVDVKNEDEQCFMWAVLAALHPVSSNPQRVSHYERYREELNFDEIQFPIRLEDIKKFERLNPTISITVIGYEKGRGEEPEELFPYYVPSTKREKHITLLLWSEGNTNHYAWIKNLNRLLSSQTKHNGELYHCERCFHGFRREELLKQHKTLCQNVPMQRTIMTDEGVYFRNQYKSEPAPFVVYADFEAITPRVSNATSSKTEVLQDHIACGYAYTLISRDPEIPSKIWYHRGKDAVEQFLQDMLETEEDLAPQLMGNKPMVLTAKEKTRHYQAKSCYICQKPFTEEDYRVRDHDHATGEYRGPAHRSCNLQKQRKQVIPVVFHNLRGYDSHLIMQRIHRVATDKTLEVIPNNMERYISFSIGKLRFIDSYQFMSDSLDTLAKNSSDFPHLHGLFGEIWSIEESSFPLLTQKGYYPYSYMDSFEKFDEETLPTKEAFFNDLTQEGITDEAYAHAQQVWKKMGCETMGDYHDVYLITCVFENFRSICLQTYDLDPAHYYTAPGLAWDAALKYTQIKLDTLMDVDHHLFIEKGIRGGTSMITHRYAKANNQYVEGYNPAEPSSHIMYLEANNLYGWAMSQPLPVGDFKWMENVEDFKVEEVPDDHSTGYILQVDLEYPQHLHDHHNDYPLAPESMKITHDMLSPYSRLLAADLQYHPGGVKKLVPNLYNKTNYILHYRNLKLYLGLGMKLTKIHRILQFQQKAWLKPYIDLNTQKRAQAKNAFEKDFFKLMNNSVFGKTMENTRKHVNVELITEPSKMKKLVAQPTFKRAKQFNEHLVAVERARQKLVLSKPVYTGFTVLDLSKVLMYEFHYHYIQPKYGAKAQLLFTDTDSLCYQIQTADVYQDMQPDLAMFDTADYPSDHILHSNLNKKVTGKMKDETAGDPIQEFVGLRPKMYSFVLKRNGLEKQEKKAKGVKKSVTKRDIRHADFKNCLFKQTQYEHSMTQIRSQNHQLQTVKLTKTSLSPYDDKRFISADGYTTFAHGHYKTRV